MKKIIQILTAIIITTGMADIVFASCPVNSAMCVSDLLHTKSSPTINNNSFSGNMNFSPSVEIDPNPKIIEEAKRNYNTIQNDTGTYDANCQFGVCLPASKNSSFPNMR